MDMAYKIFDDLSLPANIRNERNACAIMLLAKSQIITRCRHLLPKYERAMSKYSQSLIKNFFTIFNENSRITRIAFFTEPLVQALWAQFVKKQPNLIRQTLHQIGGQNANASFALNFKSDVQELE